jgi:CRISPR-associated protein Csb2
MSKFLCITVRFLQPLSHGRGDGAEPEWPPSPLRLFQALVAAAAARWNERLCVEYAAPALEWLAKQPALAVVAAVGVKSDVKYRLYVPDNVGDRVAKSWRGGNSTASIADYRTEKDVRPTHLVGDAVHYLYPISDAAELAKYKQILTDASRSITHLGWGVDMVAGNAAEMSEDEAANLPGERWRPTADRSGTPLRVPRADTLRALTDKHTAFLNRLSDGFRPVPPLTAFDVVGYRRDTDRSPREWIAFNILTPDMSGNRSFDTARRCGDVAAWVRHATGAVCQDWPDVASFIHGHDSTDSGKQLKGARADERFMYLPLPTINSKLKRVESIRRVLVAAPPGFRDRIDWLRRRLPGQELVWGENVVGLLNLLPKSDWVLGRYVDESCTWSTVTPVVLPGYDDPDGIRKRLREKDPAKARSAPVTPNQLAALETRTRGLLTKAFEHAGFQPGLLDGAGLEWRNVGFRAGVEPASQYCLPERLNGPRYHVRVRFARPIRGPLAVGAGRYRGLGTFATEET